MIYDYIWVPIALAVLGYELTGVKAICKATHIPHTHDSISALVWKTPRTVRGGIALFLLDVGVHFVFKTPLFPT